MRRIFAIVLLSLGSLWGLLMLLGTISTLAKSPFDFGLFLGLSTFVVISTSVLVVSGWLLLSRDRAEKLARSVLVAPGEGIVAKIDSFVSANPGMRPRTLQSIGGALYEHVLKDAVEDLNLNQAEIASLDAVSAKLNVAPQKAASIRRKFADKAIYRLVQNKLGDHIITANEKEEIYKLAEQLGASRATIDSIVANEAMKIYTQYQKAAISDRRLTGEEELQLQTISAQLGLEYDSIPNKDKENLAYFRLLHEIEQGNLPQVSSPIILQKNEICHATIDAERLESKIVTVGRTGGSRGISIRIAKGISYRVGSARSMPIKAEVTHRFPGILCITNKRIVFQASQKGFSVPLRSLVSMNVFENGVEFQKGSTTYILSYKASELVPLIVTVVLGKTA